MLCELYGPENVIVAGDSAGANLAMGMVINATSHIEKPLPPPAGTLLLSPWADMANSFFVYRNKEVRYTLPRAPPTPPCRPLPLRARALTRADASRTGTSFCSSTPFSLHPSYPWLVSVQNMLRSATIAQFLWWLSCI
eukprot:scaffold265261_cov32-Tisochrysis_lutea.AAC.1